MPIKIQPSESLVACKKQRESENFCPERERRLDSVDICKLNESVCWLETDTECEVYNDWLRNKR